MPVRLVLWDIDHTLLELQGLHYDLYERALPAAFGCQADGLPQMTGRTDRDSSTEFLQAHGIAPTEENLQRFWAALVEQLIRREDELPQLGRPTDGAEEALAALVETPNLYQSVLTGNLRPLAQRKLAAFALDEHLDFDIGGYGEDSLVRADLVTAARARLAAKHRITVDLAHIVLVGDTLLDIEAARASGTHIVAVATGKSTREALSAAGPDVVLADLTDPQAVIDAVMRCLKGPPRRPARQT